MVGPKRAFGKGHGAPNAPFNRPSLLAPIIGGPCGALGNHRTNPVVGAFCEFADRQIWLAPVRSMQIDKSDCA